MLGTRKMRTGRTVKSKIRNREMFSNKEYSIQEIGPKGRFGRVKEQKLLNREMLVVILFNIWERVSRFLEGGGSKRVNNNKIIQQQHSSSQHSNSTAQHQQNVHHAHTRPPTPTDPIPVSDSYLNSRRMGETFPVSYWVRRTPVSQARILGMSSSASVCTTKSTSLLSLTISQGFSSKGNGTGRQTPIPHLLIARDVDLRAAVRTGLGGVLTPHKRHRTGVVSLLGCNS